MKSSIPSVLVRAASANENGSLHAHIDCMRSDAAHALHARPTYKTIKICPALLACSVHMLICSVTSYLYTCLVVEDWCMSGYRWNPRNDPSSAENCTACPVGTYKFYSYTLTDGPCSDCPTGLPSSTCGLVFALVLHQDRITMAQLHIYTPRVPF